MRGNLTIARPTKPTMQSIFSAGTLRERKAGGHEETNKFTDFATI
jgi:hypothetical protein